MAKIKDRSPIRSKPLRVPGQSLDEQITDFFDDHIMAPSMMAIVLWLMAGWEWYRYVSPHAPQPGIATAIAGGFTIYIGWRFVHMRRRLKALKQGRDGERSVGEFFERLRAHGYRVFHDVVGDGWNIDHVLIGPAGVFTIETKTISKPSRGDSRVYFQNGKIRLMGRELARDPVPQAKAQASWLKQHFEQAGLNASVKPVVVFPGWFVESGLHDSTGVWVLEPKGFAKILLKQSEKLASEECGALATALSAYIRSHESGRR